LLVVLKAHLAHGVEHTAMDRLEAVACVGKRPADDDRHGIVEIRPAHLLFNVDRNEARAVGGRSTAVERELGVLIVWHRFSKPAEKAAKRNRLKRGRVSRATDLFYSSKARFRKTDQAI